MGLSAPLGTLLYHLQDLCKSHHLLTIRVKSVKIQGVGRRHLLTRSSDKSVSVFKPMAVPKKVHHVDFAINLSLF